MKLREKRADEVAVGIKAKGWTWPDEWGEPHREPPLYRQGLGIWIEYLNFRKAGAFIREVDPPAPYAPPHTTIIDDDMHDERNDDHE